MRMPGTAPARKSAAMETEPAVWAKMIIGIEGGMIGPMTHDARAMDVAVGRLYPPFSMVGIIMAPMEEISATAEPDTPPKNMQARMVMWARAPGIHPTNTSASRTSRVETPPRARSVPPKMKKMTANSGNEFTAESIRWTMVEWSMSSVRPASNAPRPMPKEIGRLMIMRKKKQKNAIPIVMVSPLSREWVHSPAWPESRVGQRSLGNFDRSVV